ncbi:glutamyl-tRNA reductase [Sporolactobacillus sp. CPB3-1]|uniref:Glutamyl-tRNA reductase n=1 Tax=Sporolactobacillus mangiferae TaxID=2940498 RepID=A0ABT0MDF2_9BACL|nr:glutamyl-tRNA reductase [Sporolactobacillus mangiferae]MCL1632896.1 glutamyl-tRNA reductase [Sporolactobacillus mangiferae]
MHILTIGVNYRNTPVALREKLAIQPSKLEQALTELRETKSIFEDVILSTCNRTELYVVCDQMHTGRYYSKKFFSDWFQMDSEILASYLMVKEDDEAVRHLFRVACGLDSMVLGETQILGQLKASFLTAQQSGTTGTFFNELFQEALNLGKRAQEETQINDHPVSISYAAVKRIRDQFGPLDHQSVLMVGAGSMSKLALQHLTGSGIGTVTVVNRTKEKAARLAENFGGRADDFQNLAACIQQNDVIFAATSAPDYLITKDMFSLSRLRKDQKQIVVDIGVPRNVDPAVAQIDGISLFDIDDLSQIIDHNMEARRRAARKAEQMILLQQTKFNDWLHTLGVVPVIAALRAKALSIHSETMKRIEHKLPGLTEKERAVISKQSKSMINQLLRDPINNIKELACCEHGKHAIDHFAEIFNIADRVAHTEEPVRESELSVNEKSDQTLMKSPVHIG